MRRRKEAHGGETGKDHRPAIDFCESNDGGNHQKLPETAVEMHGCGHCRGQAAHHLHEGKMPRGSISVATTDVALSALDTRRLIVFSVFAVGRQ